MTEQYCMKCMTKLSPGDTVCGHCHTPVDVQTPSHHIKPGTILKDKYLIGMALGEGGFGITYIGRDLTLDIPIAVKEFFRSGCAYRDHHYSNEITLTQSSMGAVFEKEMQRLLNEARVLAKFSDEPGIVGVRDYFRDNRTAYIVMEYLDGITLQEYVRRNGLLSCDQLYEMIRPALRTLSQVHRHGLIHRDISPDNIMVLRSGQVKLLDFGAARDVTEDKSLSVVLKHGFAPEEQYRTKGEQGPWTDVYAMCATVYCCITGIAPAQSLERIFRDELQPPSALGASISRSQEAALMHGLQVHHQNRIQSIEELQSSLEDGSYHTKRPKPVVIQPTFAMTEEPPQIPEPPEPKPNKSGKKPLLGLLLAGAACLIGFFALRGMLPSTTTPPETTLPESATTQPETQPPETTLPTETSGISAGIHQYGLYVEDCSWMEAFRRAGERGGYLARIDSPEELEILIELLENSGHGYTRFYLGGRRDFGGDVYYWTDADNQLFGDPLNGDDSWTEDLWLPGEPSFSSGGTEEYFLEMHHDDTHGWCWNDIVENLIAANDVYSGHIGYIVEYEDGVPPEPTEPPETQPSQTEPPRTEPPQTQPPQTEPPETRPPQTQPPQTQPPETEPPRTEPPETQPPQTEPPKTEPPETQPPQTEPEGVAPGYYSISLSPSTVFLYQTFYVTVNPDVSDYTRIVIHAIDPKGVSWDFVITSGNSYDLMVTEPDLTGTWTIYADVYNEYGVLYGASAGIVAYLEVLPLF